MACAQQEKTSKTCQLLSNEVNTEQQSLIVVKRLLAIAVSGITYLRGIFPGKAYGSKYVEDQKVMILKGDRGCMGASQMLQWMQGCFDAIQKKYLRTVIMSIYTDPNNPQNVTECYQFRIQYTTAGVHVDIESNNNQTLSTSCGNTKKASILLVRKLYTLMQNLGPLPENFCLNMKLAYYDDITPPDYQPPGFKEADSNMMEFEEEPVKLSMGEVATPFHCIKFDMVTEKHRLEQVEESVSVKEKWIMKVEDLDVITQDTVPKQVEKSDGDNNTDLDNTEIQVSCDKKAGTCEKVTEVCDTQMETLVKETSEMDMGIKRTRSGRRLRSTKEAKLTVNNKLAETVKEKMVSQYEILSSQDSSASVAKKKRKFSEPKDHC